MGFPLVCSFRVRKGFHANAWSDGSPCLEPFPLVETVFPDGHKTNQAPPGRTSAEASRRSSCFAGGFATLDSVGRSKFEPFASFAPVKSNPVHSTSTPRVHFKDHTGPVMVSSSSQGSSYIDDRFPWESHALNNRPGAARSKNASSTSIRQIVLNFPLLKEQKPLQKRISAASRLGPRELRDIDTMKRGFQFGTRVADKLEEKKESEPTKKEFKLDKHGCLVFQKPTYYGHRIKELDPVTGEAETVVSSVDLERPFVNPYKTPRLPVRPTPTGGRTLEQIKEEAIAARATVDKKASESTAADKVARQREDMQPTVESDVAGSDEVVLIHTRYNKELWESAGELHRRRYLVTKKKLSELRRDASPPAADKVQTWKDEPTVIPQVVKSASNVFGGSSRSRTAELAQRADGHDCTISELQEDQRELRESNRELREITSELKESHRELKANFEQHAAKTEADINELKKMGAQHKEVLEKLVAGMDGLTVQMKEVKEEVARRNRSRSSKTSAKDKVKSVEKVDGWINGKTPSQNFAPTPPPFISH